MLPMTQRFKGKLMLSFYWNQLCILFSFINFKKCNHSMGTTDELDLEITKFSGLSDWTVGVLINVEAPGCCMSVV